MNATKKKCLHKLSYTTKNFTQSLIFRMTSFQVTKYIISGKFATRH